MLNNKQKNFLRKEAMPLTSFLQIGKDGVSENTIVAIDNGLNANELVKINLLKTCPIAKEEIAEEISKQCHCDVVQIIGRTIVLFKTSKNKLFQLPK